MSLAPPLSAPPPAWRSLLAWTGIAFAAAGAGLALGLPMPWRLAPLALAAAAAAALAAGRRPAAAAALLPLLLPPPQFAKVFAYEVGLLVVAGVVALSALGARRAAVWRLDPIEACAWALFGWAVATGLWAESLWWWLFGVRKMLVGLVALWVAWRLARAFGPWRLWNGVVAGAIALGLWTLATAVQAGGLGAVTVMSRNRATDLGWGTSNFIAALLVLMMPTALHVALHGRTRAQRVAAWISVPLSAVVMAVAASRGGALLTVVLALAFVFGGRLGRRAWAIAGAAAAAVALLVAGPGGTTLLGRFTDARELGSVVVRLWYFREGWHRLVETWPLGMGLGQGYVQLDRLNTQDPHNYWLVVGPELGLVGLALWIAVLALLWIRASRMARDPAAHDAGRALQFTIVISQLNSLFEPTFQGLQYHFLFYWIAGAYLGAFPAGSGAARSSPSTSPGVTTRASA